MDLETKARLISAGTIELAEHEPFGPASTSGPGAGGQSIFFRSGGRTARLSIAEKSELNLKMLDKGVEIIRGDETIARGELVQPLLHCPDQAYITVSERCIYDCKFCAVPKLCGRVKPGSQVVEMIEKAAATGKLSAISLTSGVEVSPELEAKRIAGIVRDLRARGFEVPIGVSVTPFPGVNRIMKEAGVDEVKYNIETFDQDLFRRVCPGISYMDIKESLREAVSIFGRNRVFSNVIVGLGESDKTMRSGIDELTEIGVQPILRAVYPHPLRIGETDMIRPSAEQLLDLARYLLRALESNDLRGDLALTGCSKCTGCDLVPHRDL